MCQGIQASVGGISGVSTHGASFVEVSKLVRVFEVVGNGIVPEPESMVGVGAWAMVYDWGT